ncbi:MAG TPA: GIY-YIG nuclease family protein [Anaerolineae bacterium]|nr:GIY-YIG nuclease family protein [Anaerolineae bacterium]HID85255.1 GIY-YIG nuclease family protein [Anaerolineales bacterium]HIQ09140.1 GIY-YIG nuclease family protein [Anaerolineaceae bacterium]
MPYVYILRCADGSYYTGVTTDLARRLEEHQQGLNPRAYTFRRRPVRLVWAHEVATYEEALRLERQIKGWRRAKKEALIRGDFEALHQLVTEERRQRERQKRRV